MYKNRLAAFGILVLLLCAAGVGAAQHRRAPKTPPWIDGDQMDGFEVAAQYLMASSKRWPAPFEIKHYIVAFEGNCTYYFLPKRLPEDQDAMEHDSSYGPSVRVRVDPRRLKVISAINQ